MYKYFLSGVGESSRGNTVHFNLEVEIDYLITGMEHIMELTAQIEKDNRMKNIVILNFQLFPIDKE